MRFMRVGLWFAFALMATSSLAAAQSTTGTISGRVMDAQDLAVPGVTVTVESPNLQGVRTAVTSENGDYIITLLPSGTYTITFELSGFQRQQRTVSLAPTQVLPVDVTMGPAAVAETVEVVGQAADVLTQTAQVATNFSQTLIATLPTNRDLNASMLLAPSVHSTGPSGNYSIAGSMSYENLFLINGVTINENLRGQAFNLYIEDAIQETTIATAGVSAEYGRFGGGVVNMITKSGGNRFSGSFRDTLHNDDWRTLVPKRTGDSFANDTKLDKVVPTYEYTFGGPIFRDRLWFFTAGRLLTQEFSRNTVQTNIPYVATNKTRRYEGNATYSLNSNNRFQGTFIKETLDQLNDSFSPTTSMDLRSLYARSTPQDLFTLNYSGILSPNFFVEGRYSRRNFAFIGSGAKTTDIIEGTLLLDQQRGSLRFWSPTFCGVCTSEERDNEDMFVKGSYFLSTSGAGSHNIVVGYDNFNDIRKANNRQSGSDYRIFATTSILQGENVIPVFLNDGTTIIQWNPIPILTLGSNFRTHSVFFNDSWRATDRLTANLGIRYDKNDGKNQAGELVAKDSAWSPRFGVIWDPTGTSEWSVTGSFARYVAPIANSIADSSSAAGNPQTWQYLYRGPNINAGGVAATATPDAIRQVFDWFTANSGCQTRVDTCQPRLPTNGQPTIPGVAQKIGDALTTPSNFEYATGISRQFGARAALRADYVFRNFKDFYVSRTDLSTGKVTNSVGQVFDLTLIENDTEGKYKRRYQGVTGQGTFRFSSRFDVGATYTLSHAGGNLDGENVTSGPVTGGAYQYPEYVQESWNHPEGDLVIDQRHRARLWANYGLPWVNGLTLSVLQALESGIPYGAGGLPIQGGNANGVDARPFVTNPGYQTPIAGSATAYFYTARDAFRTEGQRRTDFAANYAYNLGMGGRTIGLFVQAQVINVFNQFQLCACGATSVFANAGAPGTGAGLQSIDRTVRTPVNAAATHAAFNPFTTTPVEGVNWSKGPNFGKALSRLAYTTPRTFRVTFGVRF
jgi:outer membrane receptor protein involved in Fe transport